MNYKSYLVEKNINLIKSNIILFYGENMGLLNVLKSKIKQNSKNASITKFDQDEIIRDEELLFNEALNISLFNDKKIIFIDQTNDKILDTIKKLEPKITNQKVILSAGLLEKKSKLRNYFEKSNQLATVACYEDNEITIKKLIAEKLQSFEGLNNSILNIIADNCNNNRMKLENELNKIVVFFDNKKIEEEKLRALLNIKENEKFNLLKDKVLIGDKITTNKLLNETIMENDKSILYLNIINQRLKKLLELNSLNKTLSLEDSIDSMKPPIFWKDKAAFIQQAKKWDSNRIKKILEMTYNLEFRLKSNSTVNTNVLFRKLLIDICEEANS